jgi:spermidine/putrescine transport system substrate-binding protein
MKKQRLANFVWLVTIGAMVGGIGFWSANFADADQPTLNLFIWSDYIPPSLITGFEQECGCKVTESNYDSNAELGAKLKAGGDAEYDVVVPTDYYVSELAEEGFLLPLDHSRLSNFKNLLPEFQNPSYDPQNKYSIPYQWGTTGIVYDATKIKNPPESWALIFDPKANPNYPFVLPRGGGRIQIGAACTYLGYGFDCAEKSQWLAAAALIESTKKGPIS